MLARMKFRPRYSLLTLLVLTALVAGGMKLWYGPHSFTFSGPASAQEQTLLGVYAEHPLFQQEFSAETQGQYLNTFAGPELLRIQGRPGPHVRWLVDLMVFGPRHGRSRLYLLPVPLADFRNASSAEMIHFWCSSPQTQLPATDPVSLPEAVSSKPNSYAFAPLRIPRGYFVSDRKRVYLSKDIILLSQIQVEQIDDPKLRVLIEQELAKIPDPQ